MSEQQIDQLSEEEQECVKAIQKECMIAIVQYLNELVETMETNKILALTPSELKAMAEVMHNRVTTEF
jgi:hypothetical protein